MTTRTPSKTPPPASTNRQPTGKIEVQISQQPVPRLPHERDESADSQASKPRKVMEQAASDLKRGLKDTDRSPETNRMSKKLKGSS